jgi:hypothetical protein
MLNMPFMECLHSATAFRREALFFVDFSDQAVLVGAIM